MELWQKKAMEALDIILGSPASTQELASLCLVAAIAFVIVLDRLASLMSFPIKGTAFAALVFIVGAFGVLLFAAAAMIYVEPMAFVKSAGLAPFLPFLAALLSIPIVMTPVLWLVHRAKFGQGLTAALLSVAAAAIIVLLTVGIIGAFRSGDKDFNRTRDRTHEVNRFLDT
ncbi:MAG: hypothetical protein QGI24_01530 [Kiritimatiellia bacterium]|jgi:hypothetical protein|nr:hypothetical protein [Kiritimatiellia bacterium]MDP6847444.1 hypothetical protein [Kiritimatiellia bacterium]